MVTWVRGGRWEIQGRRGTLCKVTALKEIRYLAENGHVSWARLVGNHKVTRKGTLCNCDALKMEIRSAENDFNELDNLHL